MELLGPAGTVTWQGHDLSPHCLLETRHLPAKPSRHLQVEKQDHKSAHAVQTTAMKSTLWLLLAESSP